MSDIRMTGPIELTFERLDEIEGILKYMIFWPLAAPFDAYRAGKNRSVLVGLLLFFIPGIPIILARMVIGIFAATSAYATS